LLRVLDKRRADFMGAAIAGGVVLALGAAAIRSELQLAAARARAESSNAASEIGERVTAQIDGALVWLTNAAAAEAARRGLPALGSVERPRTVIWRRRGTAMVAVAGSETDLTARDVEDAIATDSRPVIAPVAGANGDDFFLLHTAVADADLALSMPLTDLMESACMPRLLKGGMQVAIEDVERGNWIFWSAPDPPRDAVQTTIMPAGVTWRLAVAPTAGWRSAAELWTGFVLAWLVGIAYAVAYWHLARRPRMLSDELSVLGARLDDKDAELTTLLRTQSTLETELASSLTIDVSTGLQNRRSFVKHLQERLKGIRLTANGALLVVIVRFRQLHEISHSMGGAIADRLLSQAADRLRKACGAGAFLARTGEEDLALCVDPVESEEPADVADRLLATLDERFDLGPRALFSSTHLGIAACPDGYEYPEEMLSKASIAADAAAEEQQRWSVFRLETKERRLGMLQLEADLQSAIRREEFELHFQPILSVAEGNVVGFETLLRWHHPSDTWIGPDKFIPLAEEIGQMGRLSQWVAKKTIAQARYWLDKLERPIYLTLNLTPRDLKPEFCERLFSEISAAGLPPDRIRVEVTETAVVDDFRLAAQLISELNERGVRVLLDDFGTGYSSLSYLRDLPFHGVKIDKSFVRRMTSEARDFGLVRSIVSLVHYLGMECVAEGVETQEQLDLIEIANCNYWQGYLFSAPVVAERVPDLLRQSRMARAELGAVG
jgi:predicted signal transduction protein with EAL and GGDEF domain